MANRQVRKLLSIRLTKLQPDITLRQSKDYIRRMFFKYNIIPIDTRVFIIDRENKKATIRKHRVVDGEKQYIVHFDGNKNEQQKYMPADKKK